MNLAKSFEPYSPPETNFVDRLRYWALAQPEQLAFRFLDKGEEDEIVEINYAQLDERARAIAAKLVAGGFAGQRALMMYPPCMDFVTAFFACHYAGVVPVPAYPPRRNRNMGRINAISKDVGATVALTVDSVFQRSKANVEAATELAKIPWVATENIPLEMAGDWVMPKISRDDLGLIQYTSGSTGSPKGVMLTHRNLLANCAMIITGFGFSRSGGGLSWLPLYHDMGLIGGVMAPLYYGFPDTFMSPIAFLTKPVRWLRAISKFKATVSGGPNFAYAMCNMKITPEQCEGLDLSSWEVAFNGAEPVRAEVMHEFTRKFEPYGFRAKAHYPCYGLAETTLIVTGGSKLREPVIRTFDKNALSEHHVVPVEPDHPLAKQLVGCGQTILDEEVIIVNPETRRKLEDDQIGEIWINSPSGGTGYWNKPEISREVFRARLSPDNGVQYIRSGDLGFMDGAGELFVSGRLKDMIIVRGVNRYPQDIEATVEQCDPSTRNGGAAAFAVTRWDREHLVVVCEVQRHENSKSWGEVVERIRAEVTLEHDLSPDAIVLVRAHSIPKTSSGKVQRHACRTSFLKKELLEIARWVAWEDSHVPVVAVASTESNGHGDFEFDLPIEELSSDDLAPAVVKAVMFFVKDAGKEQAKNLTLDTNIPQLGLDSLTRTEIAARLQDTFGGTIPEEVLQDSETIREVAHAIQDHVGREPIIDYARLGTGNGVARSNGPIPDSFYKLESMPEYINLQRRNEHIKETGLRNPFFSIHEGKIGDTTRIDGRELISFASYNYLGLSGHPKVIEAAKAAIDRYGTSVSASRIVSGEKTIHRELECELSRFLDVEDVITFPGGHATNESVIGHIVGAGDLIIHDSFAHNSIIQGAQLSGARRRPFDHNDWRQLDQVLTEIRTDYRRVLIAIEGLYSMDGDYPDLPKFVDIKNRHKAWLYVDEAHSIGTMGETGRGVAEIYGVDRNHVDFWMGTLSKSFGSCGGFIGGKKTLVEFLRYTTPGYVFAAGMPPANVGAALGALKMLESEPIRVKQLQENSQLFLDLAKEAGLNTGMSVGGTPIIPIITGNSDRALMLSEALFNRGINAQPILYPAVPEKETRIRIFMTSIHTEDQIRESVEAISEEWQKIVGGANVKLPAGLTS